jgi:hypothetical protein
MQFGSWKDLIVRRILSNNSESRVAVCLSLIVMLDALCPSQSHLEDNDNNGGGRRATIAIWRLEHLR